jgi:transposase-like protein
VFRSFAGVFLFEASLRTWGNNAPAYRDKNGRPAYPKVLERSVRSELAMILAMAGIYVQGVDIREVTAIVEALSGLEVTRTQVSRAAAELGEQLVAPGGTGRSMRSRISFSMSATRRSCILVRFDHVRCSRLFRSTPLMIPLACRRGRRKTNGLDLLHKEIKRRLRVASLFPNEASLLRFASAVLSEISDDWKAERAYLNIEAK